MDEPTEERHSPAARLARRRRFAGLGVYLEPKVLVFIVFGAASGLPLGLTGDLLRTWLTELQISWTNIGLISAVGAPYALKFLWSPIVDRVPLPGLTRLLGRRRSWLALSQVLLVFSIFALGQSDPLHALGVTAAIAFAVALTSATQDIAVDAFRIETLEQRQLAAGSAVHVNGYMLASKIVAGAGMLYLAEYHGWPAAYAVMAVVMGACLIATLLMPEPEAVETPEAVDQQKKLEAWLMERPHLSGRAARAAGFVFTAVIAPFADFMRRSGWALILLFVVFFKFGDSLAGVMTNPFFIDLGFSKPEIANISKAFGLVATLGGLAIGGALLNAAGMVRSLWVCGILQLVTNFIFIGLALIGTQIWMLAVTIGFENMAAGMGTAVFVAYLSSLCNVSFTATQYALLSALAAFGRTLLSTLSGPMVDYLGWLWFFGLSAAAALPGLVLLYFMSRYFAPPEFAVNRDAP